jgi:hypothetical protein
MGQLMQAGKQHQQQQRRPVAEPSAGNPHQQGLEQGRHSPGKGPWVPAVAACSGKLLPSGMRAKEGDNSSSSSSSSRRQGVKACSADGAAAIVGTSGQVWLLGTVRRGGHAPEGDPGHVQYRDAASMSGNISSSSSDSSSDSTSGSSTSGSRGGTSLGNSGALLISACRSTSSSRLSSGSTCADSSTTTAAGSRVYQPGGPSNELSDSSDASTPSGTSVPPAAGGAAVAGVSAAGSEGGGGPGQPPPGQARCRGVLCRLYQWRCSVALQRLQEAEQRVRLAQAGCDTWRRLAEAAQQQVGAWGVEHLRC